MTTNQRVLVTGSRHLTDRDYRWFSTRLQRSISGLVTATDVIVVHGAARGADLLAHQYAQRYGIPDEPHPADWTVGRGAGPARNQLMVDLGVVLCVAFPTRQSRGTWDCVRRATTACIPTVVWPVP